jgi:ParB family chromosome partitioning protein
MVVGIDSDSTARLSAACAGALMGATQAKLADAERLRSADRNTRVAGLDMRQHWGGGIEFFDRLTRKALLAALTKASGAEAAGNCAKVGKAELAATCADHIPGRGWLPPAFITSDVPAPREIAEVVDGVEIEDDGAANDDHPMSVAAE